MKFEAWQERVVAEHEELVVKTAKLEVYLDGHDAADHSPSLMLLRSQLKAMAILKVRMKL